jgi:hypothetical protein
VGEECGDGGGEYGKEGWDESLMQDGECGAMYEEEECGHMDLVGDGLEMCGETNAT